MFVVSTETRFGPVMLMSSYSNSIYSDSTPIAAGITDSRFLRLVTRLANTITLRSRGRESSNLGRLDTIIRQLDDM